MRDRVPSSIGRCRSGPLLSCDGHGDTVPAMTPEAPGNLVVIDVSEDEDGFRYTVERWDPTPDSRHFLWTLWAAEGGCPPGFVPAAGGAVCVAADPGYLHARYSARPRVRKDRRALSWADVAEGVGIMVVAVLPAGWVYEDGSLPPREAKPFDGRMALYWRSGGGHARELRLTWTVNRFKELCGRRAQSSTTRWPTLCRCRTRRPRGGSC